MKAIVSLLMIGAFLVLVGLPVSGQQPKDAEATFAALDANKDGKLSQAEFYRLFETEGKADASPQEKQNEFKAWDADGDGSISKAEFAAKYR
jgi:Ca2+-binding EF-hand superfamily protein